MTQYIIIKQFIIGKKTYFKDKILPDGISKDLVKRLVAKGFIKSIGEVSADYEEIPFYEELEEFLAPREVSKLGKSDLLRYAEHIEADIDPTLPKTAIAKAVNEFIAQAIKENEDDEDDKDDKGGERAGKVDNANANTPPKEV